MQGLKSESDLSAYNTQAGLTGYILLLVLTAVNLFALLPSAFAEKNLFSSCADNLTYSDSM
ncbi:MAG: hypothetical protein J7J52_01235, partial [Deltaproteobacteria bacterium]|nr:hypothetical protein [Deltaproteobacteria bacterium]